MKYFLFLLFTFFTNINFAQIKVYEQTTQTFSSKTIVKDSSGNILESLDWIMKLKEGTHKLSKLIRGDNDTLFFTLIKNSSKEKASFLEDQRVKNINAGMPKESEYFKTNSYFNFFAERDIQGNKWNKKTLARKIVVVNFWFINCPPCKFEIPELNAIVEKYKNDNDIVFIGIALDDAYSLQNFLQTNPFKYNIVADGRYTANLYGINRYPTHVIVNADGKVAFHTTGLGTSTIAWIDKTIEQLSKKLK